MRYRNAPAAIEWLCQAFGFEKHLAVSGENRTVAHAQLTWGNGMMLGSVREGVFPLAIGGNSGEGTATTCRELSIPTFFRERSADQSSRVAASASLANWLTT